MDEHDIGLRKWLVPIWISAWKLVWLILVQAPTPTQTETQHHPHGPDDAFRTIKHPLLDILRHDGMDEKDISLRKWLVACADGDFGLEVRQMWQILFQAPTALLKLSTIHMGQMMPSEPSNIIIWTYQDMMEWMSRTLV
jgi:hypothetical protein